MDLAQSELHFENAQSPTESELEGEIAGAATSSKQPLDTLDEPVSATIKRDLSAIFNKFVHACYPRSSHTLLRDWDLWGPLFLCVVISLLLHDDVVTIGKAHTSRGPQFTDVFMLTFFGSCVVTLNIKLLGGRISFFQSVCVLGYCLLTPTVALVACRIILALGPVNMATFVIRLLVTSFGFIWAIYASTAFLTHCTKPKRKALAIYPIFLFYFVLSWMIISHTHYGH